MKPAPQEDWIVVPTKDLKFKLSRVTDSETGEGQGVTLSSWNRTRASGKNKDRVPAVETMQQCIGKLPPKLCD